MYPKYNFNRIESNRKFTRDIIAIIVLVTLIFLMLAGCGKTADLNTMSTDEPLEIIETNLVMEEKPTATIPAAEIAPTEITASPTVEVIRD